MVSNQNHVCCKNILVPNLEIARKVKLHDLRKLMEELEITEDEFEFYGKYTGKIKLNILEELKSKPDGKLILVTAMSPTNFGEGKTLTSTQGISFRTESRILSSVGYQ